MQGQKGNRVQKIQFSNGNLKNKVTADLQLKVVQVHVFKVFEVNVREKKSNDHNKRDCKQNDLVTDIKFDLDMLKRRSRKISGQADPNSTKVC